MQPWHFYLRYCDICYRAYHLKRAHYTGAVSYLRSYISHRPLLHPRVGYAAADHLHSTVLLRLLLQKKPKGQAALEIESYTVNY